MKTSFRAALIEALEHSGSSLRQIATRADVSYDQLKKLLQKPDATTNVESAVKVAGAFGMGLDAFLEGKAGKLADPPAPDRFEGLAEECTPFIAAPAQDQAVRAMFAGRAQHPQILLQQRTDLPGLGLRRVDLVVIDLGREPARGDLVALHVTEGTTSRTVLRLHLSPWLLASDAQLDNPPLRDDDPGVTIRYPVVGIVRGLPPD